MDDESSNKRKRSEDCDDSPSPDSQTTEQMVSMMADKLAAVVSSADFSVEELKSFCKHIIESKNAETQEE